MRRTLPALQTRSSLPALSSQRRVRSRRSLPFERALLAIVAALALLASTAHAAPSRSLSPVEHVVSLLDEWRVDEAQQALEALERDRPGEPDTLVARACVRFQLGDYAGAVTDFESAVKKGVRLDDELRSWRDLAVSTERATHDYLQARSPDGHVVVRYTGRDKVLVPYIFETLGAARREIAERDFDALAVLGDPVRVDVYPEVKHLAKVSTLTVHEIETSGTIALCKWNRLMIVSPRALVHGYPWLDTLSHEFTHFVVSKVSRNTVPIWLHEGLAKFEERRWRLPAGASALPPVSEHLLATALAPKSGKRLITFEEMYPSMAKLPSQADTALAFAEVFTVVEYLYGQKGWPGVRQVIERMRSGQGDAGAVAAVLGQSYDEFLRAWKTWLRGRKLREHRGLVPSTLKFKKALDGAAQKPQPREDDDTADITEDKVRRFARLAGMLRAGKRLPAAAVEYEKARAVSTEINLPVAQKLSRTYLELEQLDGAVKVAEPAFELYPDSGGLAVTLGEAWRKKGDLVKAAVYFEAALRVNPFDPKPHCGLAQILDGGDARSAREREACTTMKGE